MNNSNSMKVKEVNILILLTIKYFINNINTLMHNRVF